MASAQPAPRAAATVSLRAKRPTSQHTGPVSASGPSRTWTIREIAEEFSVTHRTVRHYEELGLITPERRGTARIYHRRDRTRLALIMRGKRLGFPLEEIRTIIDLYDAPRGKTSQLEYAIGQARVRRAELEARRHDIDESLAELAAFEASCQADLEQTRSAT